MYLDGIHHISAITGDARRNLDFYTRVLGLRLVAKTVNQDDPGVYHLFYGSGRARPGGGARAAAPPRPRRTARPTPASATCSTAPSAPARAPTSPSSSTPGPSRGARARG